VYLAIPEKWHCKCALWFRPKVDGWNKSSPQRTTYQRSA